MSLVTVNDIEMYFDRIGTGPPILLLHGLGSSARDWENQVEPFSEGHGLIIPDLRGHGRSDKPAGPYSMGGFASDVAQLIDQLDVGSLPVVGISLGGMIAFQLAADRPDLVSKLIIVNALQVFETKRISQRIQIAIRKVMTRRLSMEKIGEILSNRLFPDPDMEEQRATMVKRWAENDKAAYQATFDAILAWPGAMDAMRGTDIPITIINSEFDYVGLSDKQPYFDRMPTSTVVVIPDAHHGVPMEQPEVFNEELAKALV